LGASNVALSFATIVQTIRRSWDEPVEIMAAIGHGRSYGQDSRVLGRKISGIFPCALWQDLHDRPPLPTAALVTDVGNDLLYGATPEKLLEWVAACLDRLAEVGATTIITELPLASLARLGDARFHFFRALLFPRSRLTLAAARESVAAVNEGLAALANSRKMSVIPVSDAWFGFDPIHLRAGVRQSAWPALLAGWREGGALSIVRGPRVWERVRLATLSPYERSIFGISRRAAQPIYRFAGGTTISLY
jgi:hypothetical protein